MMSRAASFAELPAVVFVGFLFGGGPGLPQLTRSTVVHILGLRRLVVTLWHLLDVLHRLLRNRRHLVLHIQHRSIWVGQILFEPRMLQANVHRESLSQIWLKEFRNKVLQLDRDIQLLQLWHDVKALRRD